MSIFKGSGVAIVTPFKKDGSVDYKRLEELIDFQIQNGTDAIIICGTTGEASTLSDEEQLECIKVAIDHTAKRVPVIAGTGSNDTHHGIKLCVAAQNLGADGLLLVTPYYNKTSQKGLIEHYTMLANSVDIPIILYNVPSRTGMYIMPKTAAELSKIDNIVAIKEASGNIAHVVELVAACEGRLDLYSGNDDQVLPLLSLGGLGVISVAANIMPREMHDMVHSYFEGNHEKSLKLQMKMFPVMKSLFCDVNPIPIKQALAFMGQDFDAGICRHPLTTMDDTGLAVLRNAMSDYGFKLL